jgi:hypothetical protein
MSLCLYVVLSCAGRGLCDELITRPKDSCHASNKIRETLKRRSWPDPGWSAIGEKQQSSNAKFGTIKKKKKKPEYIKYVDVHVIVQKWMCISWVRISGQNTAKQTDISMAFGLLGCNAVWTCGNISTFR